MESKIYCNLSKLFDDEIKKFPSMLTLIQLIPYSILVIEKIYSLYNKVNYFIKIYK